MIVVALTSFGEAAIGFVILWCVAVAGITGINVWTAFSEKGSLASWSSGPPASNPTVGGGADSNSVS